MSNRINIIGAGESGLFLSICLIKRGFDVTLYTEKKKEEIIKSPPTSSQAVFKTGLNYLKQHRLDFWENDAPKNNEVEFSLIAPNGASAFSWKGETSGYFQSIDQRIKFSKWIECFCNLGGKIIYKKIDTSDLHKIQNRSDLTILATGKGKLSNIFKKDPQKSQFNKPQRKILLAYVTGANDATKGVRFNALPGIGEFFTLKGLSRDGVCHMTLLEGIPSGPFDCWDKHDKPRESFKKLINLLRKHLPYEYENFKKSELMDDCSLIIGSITPEVRKPFYEISENRFILGMADSVILNDPIAGQGANLAYKGANLYLEAIVAQKNRPFDLAWMKQTYSTFWKEAQWSVAWSNLLLQPPTESIKQLLHAASQHQPVANLLSDAFDNPEILFPLIQDATLVEKYIETYSHHETI